MHTRLLLLLVSNEFTCTVAAPIRMSGMGYASVVSPSSEVLNGQCQCALAATVHCSTVPGI